MNGVGRALFLVCSGLYVLVALVGLLFLHTVGPDTERNGELFLGPDVDRALFGKSPRDLMMENPGVRRFALSNLSNVCGLLIGLGTSTGSIAWFGRGERRATWSCLLAHGSMLLVYWLLVMLPAIRFANISHRRMYHPYAVIPTVLVPFAAILSF